MTVEYDMLSDKGVRNMDQFAKGKFMLVPLEKAQVIERLNIPCPDCNSTIDSEIKGFAMATVLEDHCTNELCTNFNLPRSFKISYFYP